jgi:hypothetical protein
MANTAFNFKGIYDKIAGLLKTSDIIDPTLYTPSSDDYVAVYKNVPGSPDVNGNTIAIKNYVSVTDIGIGGGGGGGGGTMSSFDVSSTGGITLSVNAGATYTEGPFTIENLDELIINSSSVPNGLNWRGSFSAPSSGSTFEINDVVYTTTGSPAVYRTWFAIQEQPVSGAVAPPTNTDYSNAYWALLGTQGPAGTPGSQGAAGLPSATATFGFKPVSATGVYTTITTSGTPGDGTNDVGKIFLLNNNSTTAGELVVTINAGLSGGASSSSGWPFNSQITFMNVTADALTNGNPTGAVKIVGASGVTIKSADGANYLRTQYSSCSVVRYSANEYYMFGDLTNIA